MTFMKTPRPANPIPRQLFTAAAGTALALSSASAASQTAASYPDKPVKFIIPFPPGGTLDKVGRMRAVKLGEQFGHNVVVENQPGGNGDLDNAAIIQQIRR